MQLRQKRSSAIRSPSLQPGGNEEVTYRGEPETIGEGTKQMKIGNLKVLPWYLRLAMFVGVATVLYGGFWYLVTRPARAETQEFNNEIAQLLAKNAQAQIASQRLNEFRAVYKARQEEYEELKALLPEQREITMVLQNVHDRARNNGLVLS